jgi:hypothetical protein
MKVSPTGHQHARYMGTNQRSVLHREVGVLSPKGPCAEGWVPSLWCHWKVVEPIRGRAQWEEVRPLEVVGP